MTNAAGCATTSAATPVTVNANPAATITPSGPTTLCEGGSVTLTASPGASYQWSTGATSQSIVVTQSGNYTVTVTSASGCSTTSSATPVVVRALPTAAVSGGATICQGSSANVSVNLTGTAPFTIVWSDGFVQNVAASVAARSVSPSVSTTYAVTSVTDASCAGSASGSATINVNPATAITAQPQGQTVKKNTSAVLSVSASGTGTLSYQWFEGSSGDTSNPVGSNSSTFVTPRLRNNTSYWVRVSGSCGSVNSQTALIQIK